MSEFKQATDGKADNPVDVSKDVNIQVLITEGKNPRGIPGAKFIVQFAFYLTLFCLFGVRFFYFNFSARFVKSTVLRLYSCCFLLLQCFPTIFTIFEFSSPLTFSEYHIGKCRRVFSSICIICRSFTRRTQRIVFEIQIHGD